MNVEVGTDAAQFPEKEYVNEIFLAVRVWLAAGGPGGPGEGRPSSAGGATPQNAPGRLLNPHREQPGQEHGAAGEQQHLHGREAHPGTYK